MDKYAEAISFIVEMNKQSIHLQIAEPIKNDQETKYRFTIGGVPGQYTQSEIRRMLNLKAFW